MSKWTDHYTELANQLASAGKKYTKADTNISRNTYGVAPRKICAMVTSLFGTTDLTA
jgi:hypothetical protein